MRKLIPLIIAIGVFAAPTAAQAKGPYVLPRPKHEYCRAHYVRRIQHVRRRVHGHARWARETLCIPLPEVPSHAAPAPSPAQEAAARRLAAEVAKLKAENEARKRKEEAAKREEEGQRATERAEVTHREEVVKKETEEDEQKLRKLEEEKAKTTKEPEEFGGGKGG